MLHGCNFSPGLRYGDGLFLFGESGFLAFKTYFGLSLCHVCTYAIPWNVVIT